jgi:3-dehydroquinate synthase
VRTLVLETAAGNCAIHLGEALGNLASYSGDIRTVVVTDANVRKHHGAAFGSYPILEIGLGEEAKTLDTVEHLYRQFSELELDRSCLVAAVGGGIVCDVAGFAASTYLRGLDFAFAPTTLLAQVDASIGGKNGVNLDGYKNLVGLFKQPLFVLTDFAVLSTLPERELRCGLAEVVKHAAIADAGLFDYLEDHAQALLSLQPDVVEKVICDSVRIKVAIVSADVAEHSGRIVLNFGHTLGHAIEKVHGLPHGEAVSIGMVAAAKLSAKRGLLPAQDVLRLESLLGVFGLPTALRSLDAGSLLEAVAKDKKRRGAIVQAVLLKGLGHAYVETMAIGEFSEVLDDLREHR